jgi:hypothetical protein
MSKKKVKTSKKSVKSNSSKKKSTKPEFKQVKIDKEFTKDMAIEKELEQIEDKIEETNLEIQQKQFHEFLPAPQNAPAPVLKPVENQSPQILEESFPLIQDTQTSSEDTRAPDYATASNAPSYSAETGEGGPQYNTSNQGSGPPVLSPAHQQSQERSADFVDPLQAQRVASQAMQPGLLRPEFTESSKRSTPFGKEDREYKEVRL